MDATIDLNPRASDATPASFFNSISSAASPTKPLEADTVLSNLHAAIMKRSGPLSQVFCATSVYLQGLEPPSGAAPVASPSGYMGAGTSSKRETSVLESSADKKKDVTKGAGMGGLLEIFVIQARSLPTQEWTQVR